MKSPVIYPYAYEALEAVTSYTESADAEDTWKVVTISTPVPRMTAVESAI